MRILRTALTAAGVCAGALWTFPAFADDISGAKPGDAAMTCDQIGAELAPYAQQMAPAANALGQTSQEVIARGQKRQAEVLPEVIGLTAAATAADADPTGLATKGVVAAQQALLQREWNRSVAEDKPLRDQMNAQTNAVVAQGTAIGSDARVQRLMQLAQEKNCH
jgi:hypothetical protein